MWLCLGEGAPGQPCSPSCRSRGLWPCASVLPPVNWGALPAVGVGSRQGASVTRLLMGWGPGHPRRPSTEVPGEERGGHSDPGVPTSVPPLPLSTAPLLSMEGLPPTPWPWSRLSAHSSLSEALESRGHGGH